MSDIPADPDKVACCGLYCGACKSYLTGKCGGCRAKVDASWCQVRSCCQAKGIATCASCDEYSDPRDCGKFDNMMSRLFGLLFRSNRGACIDQIKQIGLDGHAQAMAAAKKPSLPRK